MNDPATPPATASDDEAVRYLDLDLIAELVEVERASATDLFDRFLDRLASGESLAPTALQAAQSANDCPAMAAQCHKIKGVAASFGLRRVAQLADALERAASAGELPASAAISAIGVALLTDAASLRRNVDRLRQNLPR